MAKIDITPKTHLLLALQQGNIDATRAFGELIDNSIGHGRAKNVVITISPTTIVVEDDGVGIGNFADLFTIASTSSHKDRRNIGNFGIGSKDAMLHFGQHLVASTTHGGRYYEVAVDWKNVQRSGSWAIDMPDPDGVPSDGPSGTRIEIGNLNKKMTGPAIDKLIGALGVTFAPALRNGVNIVVNAQTRVGGPYAETRVQPFEPPCQDTFAVIGGTVESKLGPLRWSGVACMSNTVKEATNGVFIAFTHRVIEVTKDPFRGLSAPTLHVWVELNADDDWKGADALTRNKDKIKGCADELMDSIHVEIEPMLRKAADKAEHIAIRGILSHFESVMNQVLLGAGEDPGCGDPERMPGGQRGTEPIIEPGGRTVETHPESEDPECEKGEKVEQPGGLTIELAKEGHLNDKAYAVLFSEGSMILRLEPVYHRGIIFRGTKDGRVPDMLLMSYLGAALAERYVQTGARGLKGLVHRSLSAKFDGWESADLAASVTFEMFKRANIVKL